MSNEVSREKAFDMLSTYTKNKNLIKHGLVVEAVMKHFATLNNEDVEKWGIIGLIHDVDYDMYPDEHCTKCKDIMQEHGFSEEYIYAVQSHGYGLCSEVEPIHIMEKILYTIDELTGLILAVALMKPNKSLFEVDLGSVKKKWKQKGFAAGANREVIQNGANMLGMDLDYIIEETINGMRNIASEIGLDGTSTNMI
ncbi:MAG TPA: hydrolase [Clostridiales bacterium]|nr:MAG: hydrolase [Clostridiales bacterium GWD2_32_19]HCC07222.1 hydrolase [Clostridiales bacterium]